MSDFPLVTIVIVSWNSKNHLNRCFHHLKTQTFKNFEIVLIDNGSTDGTLDDLKTLELEELNLTEVKCLNENLGFSVANNIGVKAARGKWIVLLNADAYPEADWLEQLLFVAERNPEYTFFTSRQIQFNSPQLLDGAGDDYHISGLAWRRYYNSPVEKYGLDQTEVFSACAAAAMYRREDFLKIGGFDEDYFAYFEDVDLSFRLRLIGGKCLYVPQAVVHHVGSASTGKTSDFVIYHGHRNLVWTFIKDMPFLLLLFYLPVHLFMNLYFLAAFTIKQPEKANAILSSKVDAIKKIPRYLQKRQTVQKMRLASTLDIYRALNRNLLAPRWISRQRHQQGGE